MKCPYCGNEMKLGRIEADHVLTWIPDGEKRVGGTRWSKSANSVVLADYSLFTPAKAMAFYCEACRKIVIDL